MRCAAAGFNDAGSHTIAAVSISGPASRINDARLREFARLVAEAARALRQSLASARHIRTPLEDTVHPEA